MKRTVLLLVLILGCAAQAADSNRVKAVLFPFREAILSARVESTLLSYRFRIGEKFDASLF